jgi:hypothetical protein
MPDADQPSTIWSDTFDFPVDGVRFRLHRSLVARISEPLESLMEGHMREARDGSCPMSDIDTATFGRFAEFAYTGDYTPALPVQQSEATSARSTDTEKRRNDGSQSSVMTDSGSESDELPDNPLDERPRIHNIIPSRKKNPTLSQQDHFDLFDGRESLLVSEIARKSPRQIRKTATGDAFSLRSMFLLTSASHLDQLPLLMSHAKLYVFADRWIVTDLRSLAARRLDEAVAMFEYSSTSPTDIATLIKYAYDHTPPRKDKADILRRIVTVFAANNIHALRQSPNFGELQCEGGDFQKDLMERVCDRFNA